MSLVAEIIRTEHDSEQVKTAERLSIDEAEGATSFAFGEMPAEPWNKVYMDGWLRQLQASVQRGENGQAIYPEGTYRAPTTTERNAQIFAEIPGPEEF